MDFHVGYGKMVEVSFILVVSGYPDEIHLVERFPMPKQNSIKSEYCEWGWDAEMYAELYLLTKYKEEYDDPNVMVFITGIKEVE